MYTQPSQIKVLHLFNEIKFSGAEIMYASAASYFIKNNINLYAFSTGKELGEYCEIFKKNGIKVWHVEIKKITGLISLLKNIFIYYPNLYRFLKDEKINILHIHRNDLYIPAYLAWIANVGCIKTQHNVFKNRWFTLWYAKLQRRITSKLFNVKYHSIGDTVFNNELNYYKNKSILINNWYNNNKFYVKNPVNKTIVIDNKVFDESYYKIISVGSCTRIKNHKDIIKALSLLDNKFKFIYIHLGVGETKCKEVELSIELGLRDKIFFLDNQEDVMYFLSRSNVFIMTSLFEGLAIAAIEAMACGLPLILYNSPGLSELINQDNNGFLIENSFTELAKKLIIMQNNLNLSKKMGESAASFAKQNYSMNSNVEKIISLYKELI